MHIHKHARTDAYRRKDRFDYFDKLKSGLSTKGSNGVDLVNTKGPATA